MKSVETIAGGLPEITGDGDDDDDGGSTGETCEDDCDTSGCGYCCATTRQFLMELVDDEANKLPGVCLKCFFQEGKDSLRSWYCTKPGHSDLSKKK